MAWLDEKLEWVAEDLLNMDYISDEDDWNEFQEFMQDNAERFFIEKNLMDLT